jgi:putative glutathione S-transferase
MPGFKHSISKDGDFKPEKGRYHLYVAYGCPFAHRAIVARKMKGLEEVVSMDILGYKKGKEGWRFSPELPDCTPDTVNGCHFLREVYLKVDKDYEGSFSVPVLWDKTNKTIVNNESGELIRIFGSAFNEFISPEQASIDFYPPHLRSKIDELNGWIFKEINVKVYHVGNATTQEVYDKEVRVLFAALDRVEEILSHSRYLTGPTITEADVRLYTTLVRFDPVYVGHFKCNKKRIVDYPNLWGYLRDLYQTPGFGDTTNRFHFEQFYQGNPSETNPHGIVAIGPELDYSTPHGREKM